MARRITLVPDAPPPSAEALQIDYAEALNAQQHAAATAPGEATLIVAGAGTGKTRALVYRVAYLVETGTPPEQIALLTFTRRASREMLARASALLDGRCRHVLVDEYQDTNPMQARLVRRFASVHENVTVVGDDAQSIYAFRGADYRNIFRFPDEFPGARVLKLEQNYRSTQPILDLANCLIEQAEHKYDKVLFTEAGSGASGDRPAVVPAPDDRTEVRFVGQMVHTLRSPRRWRPCWSTTSRSWKRSTTKTSQAGKRPGPFRRPGRRVRRPPGISLLAGARSH